MDLKQTAKNNMYKAVLGFIKNFINQILSFKRAAAEADTFTSLNGTLDGYIAQQAGTSSGVTGQKDALFANMLKVTVKASRKALVYAIDQNDADLQAIFDVQNSDLLNMPQSKALAIVENINDALQPLSGKLDDYRVTADDIKAIGDAITAYEGPAGTPQNAKANIEAGTKGIAATMPLIDKSLNILDDLIVHGMDDDPDLVNAYRKVRRIIETGTRHTGLVATINNASGTAIEGAVMEVQELKKKAVSDILGVADIESMKPGMYHVIFSADGYASQTQILKIEQGKTLTEEVVMVKEVN